MVGVTSASIAGNSTSGSLQYCKVHNTNRECHVLPCTDSANVVASPEQTSVVAKDLLVNERKFLENAGFQEGFSGS